MKHLPNLAGRPFVNRTPILRLAVVAWVLAVLALGLAGYRYWNHFMGLDRRQEQMAEVDRAIARERQAVESYRQRLQALDLSWQNRQIAFLNERIDARAFSWSRLFDHLAEVLPQNVRLERLTPSVRHAESGSAAAAEAVSLVMNGSARTRDPLYAFVDAMFAHRAFDRPVLSRETTKKEVQFNLSVRYLPDAAPVEEPETESDTSVEEIPASTAAAGGAP